MIALTKAPRVGFGIEGAAPPSKGSTTGRRTGQARPCRMAGRDPESPRTRWPPWRRSRPRWTLARDRRGPGPNAMARPVAVPLRRRGRRWRSGEKAESGGAVLRLVQDRQGRLDPAHGRPVRLQGPHRSAGGTRRARRRCTRHGHGHPQRGRTGPAGPGAHGRSRRPPLGAVPPLPAAGRSARACSRRRAPAAMSGSWRDGAWEG